MLSNQNKHIEVNNALDDLLIDINRINMDWRFREEEEFERIATAFLKRVRSKGGKVHYLRSTNADVEALKEMKNGEVIDFGNNTFLEKVGDEPKLHYIYVNKNPLVFGLHKHLEYNETLKPLLHPITIYIYKGKNIPFITKKINPGETYTVPKQVKHGAIFFNGDNRTELMWH